ncbi:MAG TPA: hypothetical protein V6C88_14290 [Chroococcidiopsis sp.]
MPSRLGNIANPVGRSQRSSLIATGMQTLSALLYNYRAIRSILAIAL